MKKIFILIVLLCALSLFGGATLPDKLDSGVVVTGSSDPLLDGSYNPYPDTTKVYIWQPSYEYEVAYSPKDESLTITYNNGTALRKVFPVYDLEEKLKTGEYKKYDIYYEAVIHSPGMHYGGDESTDDGGYISDGYCEVIMLDTLFNQLIRKRVKHEAEKSLRNHGEGLDSCKIKSIYIIDRIEQRTTVYGE